MIRYRLVSDQLRKQQTGDYFPFAAHQRAAARRPRPKPAKLRTNAELRNLVQELLDPRWSPEQICRTLPYRPATAEDRASPGHWEGDLIMGAHNRTAIGTLVERATRYVLLVHLPPGRNAAHFRDRLITMFSTLPAGLRQSLAWDQGIEMGRHAEFTAATSTPVYFCDPASPWQRGSNKNTSGLLRQYFPKSSDLSVHTAEDLTAVAAELNHRPAKSSTGTPPLNGSPACSQKPHDHTY